MHASTRLILDPLNRFKDAGLVADSLTGNPECNGEVPLRCQQELHTQEFLVVPTGKNLRGFKSGERGGHAVGPLYLSVCYGRCD
jgi:hypothetical protein